MFSLVAKAFLEWVSATEWFLSWICGTLSLTITFHSFLTFDGSLWGYAGGWRWGWSTVSVALTGATRAVAAVVISLHFYSPPAALPQFHEIAAPAAAVASPGRGTWWRRHHGLLRGRRRPVHAAVRAVWAENLHLGDGLLLAVVTPVAGRLLLSRGLLQRVRGQPVSGESHPIHHLLLFRRAVAGVVVGVRCFRSTGCSRRWTSWRTAGFERKRSRRSRWRCWRRRRCCRWRRMCSNCCTEKTCTRLICFYTIRQFTTQTWETIISLFHFGRGRLISLTLWTVLKFWSTKGNPIASQL